MSSVRGFRRVLGASIAALALWLGGEVSLASAQDDWSITRDAKPKPRAGAAVRKPAKPKPVQAPVAAPDASSQLIERTYRAFVAAPEDGFALKRLRELWLLREGSLDSLLTRLRDEQLADVSRVEPALALAHVLVVLDRREEALTMLAPFQQDSRAILLSARVLRELSRLEEAERAYIDAAQKGRAPADRQLALRALAELALERSDVELARARFTELARAQGDVAASEVELARALSKRGKHADAAVSLQRVISARRGDARAVVPLLRDLAAEQLAAGDVAGAKQSLERALSPGSSNAGYRAELYDLSIEAARRSDGLRELAERLSRDAAGGIDAASRAARLWDELGEEPKAVEAYRNLLRKNPRDLDARRALSQVLLRAGRLDEVIVEQRELVRLAPEEPQFVVGLCELLKQVGRPEEAERLAHEASTRAPQSLPLHRALAELYARWGDSARAEAELSLLAKLDPDDPVHTIALGSERFERGDRPGALTIWKRLLERAGPNSAEGHASLSAVLADHDWLDLAIEHAQIALTLSKDDVDAQRALASLYERAARFSEAEASWQATLKLKAADPATRREARQHIVSIWARLGTLKRHQVDLDERVQQMPRDLESARLLAEAHAHEPGMQAARREQLVLEKIMSQAPSDVESLRALERSYTRSGNKAETLRTLERLIAADPLHAPDFLRRAVELSLASYRDADALRFAQRAVEVSPDDARALRLLGDLHRGLRNFDAAQAAYAKALQVSPRDFETALVLSQVEVARGQIEAAERALLLVIQGSPDDELLSRAARALVQLDVSRSHLERVEPAFLSAALAHPERPLHRKLLVELYASWLVPSARRVFEGKAQPQERELLSRIGRRALKPLLEALLDDDPLQRAVALDLLGAMQNKNAASPLLSLAENSKDGGERARALIAVGLLSDPALGPRLRALCTRAEGRLRPIAVWALARSLGDAARKELVAFAADGDAGVRVIAALALGAIGAREAEPTLRSLLVERHPSVRAAALLSLSRTTEVTDLAREALAWGSPAWQVAIASQVDPAFLARALVSAQAEQRAYAESRLAPASDAEASLLATPSWPFVPKSYVLSAAERHAVSVSARDVALAMPAALAEALADPARRAIALQMLVATSGRLSLGPIEASLDCGTRASLAPQLESLEPQLSSLAASTDRSERKLALLALARLRPDAPSILAALAEPTSPDLLTLLDALSEAPKRAPSLRSALERLASTASDWPTRLHARRALGRAPAGDAEPLALVRAAAQTPASAISTECKPSSPAALN